MRAKVNVTIEVNAGGDILQAYVAALLEPLLTSCDVNLRTIHVTVPQMPLLGVVQPPETENDHG